MARVEHVALWTRDLEGQAAFWADVFGATLGPVYESRNRPGFRSVFATLPDGPRLELMTGPWVGAAATTEDEGWAHVAVALGDRAAVDAAAARMRTAGRLVSGPRETGDGYYEAVIRAPGGCLVEIMADF
ncbi:VOC family protein [Wenxinia marina]|uniref:Lactoylglutathione lyase n=1 Tax=Wenxinia marina DSM 24838 TaxID=1123501 RepID=A0A0D0NSH0_9RHOB|nr:VOC family protein [Wenxinia marina]KIQ71155.1 Lactoylglutathione lyase [Wenxinia marina DSM 24838]GGL54407.1 bleomycin resistance protein [Wenxinia marina]